MPEHSDLPVEFLKRALSLTDDPTDRVHPDDETLALFVDNLLSPDQHRLTVAHLVDCAACRRIVGSLASVTDPVVFPRRNRISSLAMSFVLAASVLAMVSAYWLHRQSVVAPSRPPDIAIGVPRPSSSGALPPSNIGSAADRLYDRAVALLAKGDFDAVRRVLDEAKGAGIDTSRLRSLEVPLAQRLTDPIALNKVERLTEYGFDFDGLPQLAMKGGDAIATTGANGLSVQSRKELVKALGGHELEPLLNRGQLLLGLSNAEEAQVVFAEAIKRYPQNSSAWVGKGIAAYLLDDYRTAVDAFREALRLDPKRQAAKLNLAVALNAVGARAEAKSVWQEMLDNPLTPTDREKIEKLLKKQVSLQRE